MMNILIADDHQIIIDGITNLLENEKEMEVIGKRVPKNLICAAINKAHSGSC